MQYNIGHSIIWYKYSILSTLDGFEHLWHMVHNPWTISPLVDRLDESYLLLITNNKQIMVFFWRKWPTTYGVPTLVRLRTANYLQIVHGLSYIGFGLNSTIQFANIVQILYIHFEIFVEIFLEYSWTYYVYTIRHTVSDHWSGIQLFLRGNPNHQQLPVTWMCHQYTAVPPCYSHCILHIKVQFWWQYNLVEVKHYIMSKCTNTN